MTKYEYDNPSQHLSDAEIARSINKLIENGFFFRNSDGTCSLTEKGRIAARDGFDLNE